MSVVRCRVVSRARVVAGVVWLSLLGCVLGGFCAVPASARVIHRVEGSLAGEGLAAGLGGDLLGVAVDDAAGVPGGGVWVQEAAFDGQGTDAVYEFDSAGSYANVKLTGAGTPAGAFQFASKKTAALGSAIAVDDSLSLNGGDLYVADTAGQVIDRFSPDGEFLCQIAGSETEKVTPGAECAAGGSGLAGAMLPASVAVDSSGDLYVADDKAAAILEFGPEGHLLREIKKRKEDLSKEMGSIAVDSSGDIYVGSSFGSRVRELNPQGEPVENADKEPLELGGGGGVFGVAVDEASTPNEVYVDELQSTKNAKGEPEYLERIGEYEPSGALRSITPVGQAQAVYPGLGVDPASGRLYAAAGGVLKAQQTRGVLILGPGIVQPDVASEAATSITTTGATLHGTVQPDFVHEGGDVTSCEFEYVSEPSFQASGYEHAGMAACEASRPMPYREAEQVSATVAGLPESTTYRYRLVAADKAFEREPNDGEGEADPEEMLSTLGPPTVEGEPSSNQTTGYGVTLSALIDPHGFGTSCEVQYVDESEFQASGYEHPASASCSQGLGAGTSARTASASVILRELHMGSTYHYRFLASNEQGSSTGEDGTFKTWGIESFSVEALGPGGTINQRTDEYEGAPAYTQAGGHPYLLRTSFTLSEENTEGVGGVIKDVQTSLPAGLIGNPTAVPTCTREQLIDEGCPGSARLGTLHLYQSQGRGPLEVAALYNLVPPAGVPVEFGAFVGTVNLILYIDSNVRTGGDYGVSALVSDAPALAGVSGATVEIWGDPAAHDGQPPAWFLRMPTSCAGPLEAGLRMDSWQAQGQFVERSAVMPALTGCETLGFEPSFSARASVGDADSPSGLELSLGMPQSEPNGLGESDLQAASVRLPVGVTANPAAANGRAACSEAQVGIHEPGPAGCPESSKVGSVEVTTPLLSEPLHGGLYLASQDQNPFGSLLALYLVAEGGGARVKLAGHVEANPLTGQLTTTFQNDPQLPFSELHVHLFGGPNGVIATRQHCGSVQAEASLTPWDGGPPVSLQVPLSFASGPGGGSCPAGALPFTPSMVAGTQSTQAAGSGAFSLEVSRYDGEQRLSRVGVTLPPGLTGIVASVPQCGEPAAAQGTCPADSQIGEASVTSGVGPDPVSVSGGRVYLTGPYGGGPFGLSVVVPAVAGPFNLGNVVVRSAIRIDPHTAQVSVISDPLPQMVNSIEGLQSGIPTDLRSIHVTINRPGFIINPTSCDAMEVTSSLGGAEGATSAPSSRFQAGGCQSLPFQTCPDRGRGRPRQQSQRYRPPGQDHEPGARAARTSARSNCHPRRQLPRRQPTLNKACLASVFEANPASCPEGSVIGTGTVHTPVLKSPLSGPAYLVSYGDAEIPRRRVRAPGRRHHAHPGRHDRHQKRRHLQPLRNRARCAVHELRNESPRGAARDPHRLRLRKGTLRTLRKQAHDAHHSSPPRTAPPSAGKSTSRRPAATVS